MFAPPKVLLRKWTSHRLGETFAIHVCIQNIQRTPTNNTKKINTHILKMGKRPRHLTKEWPISTRKGG